MKRLLYVTAATLLTTIGLFAGSARAQDEMPAGEHARGAIGFHGTSAPIGVRWWLGGEKIGLDAGFGFTSSPAPAYPDEKVTSWTLDLGVPLVMKSWSRVHVLLRPGFSYQSQQEVITSPPTPFDTDNQTAFGVSGELEAEVFLADNVSVSASEGVQYNNVNPVGPGSNITNVSTVGRNFTDVGFHVYFLGGK